MSPNRHKKKLLRLMTKIRNEVSRMTEEQHIKYPYKNLQEVEIDIHDLTQEIERMELMK